MWCHSSESNFPNTWWCQQSGRSTEHNEMFFHGFRMQAIAKVVHIFLYTPRRTARISHTQTFSRVWPKEVNWLQHVLLFMSPKKKVLSHAQSLWPDLTLLPQRASSQLFPSHSGNPCDPHIGGQSGRLAEQSSLTGYEPNVTVEVSSAEVTLVLSVLRRASFGLRYKSGEDVTTTPVSSEGRSTNLSH